MIFYGENFYHKISLERSDIMPKEIDNVTLQIKENINLLINNGKIEEAKVLVDEYKKMVSDDIEIYSIEAVIAIMEDNFEEAESILKEGLSKDYNNFDLLYNLGYLYEKKNNITEALATYNIARITNIKNTELVEMLQNKITKLDKKAKKYTVVLYGNYYECLKFKEQYTEWDVVGICTENKNVNTISIEDIKEYNCDFIFVVEELNKEEIIKKISQNHINKKIYFFEDFKVSVIEGLDYKISKLLGRKKINGIITGLSYAEVGIREDMLPNNFINFAFSAQDLYYDFKLLKYLYKFQEVKNSLQYVILNLAYYSFDYDMSMTISKYRIHRYRNYLEDYHNNNDFIGLDINKSFYEKVVTFDEYIKMNKMKEVTVLKNNDINGEYEALRNSTMNFKDTRQEYEIILNEYLLFLKENNIKPIIVICPTSSNYRKIFNKSNKKTTFYRIINKLKERYKFQIIDYFESSLFDETDFWDYSHLNGKGADKFTKILKNEIVW